MQFLAPKRKLKSNVELFLQLHGFVARGVIRGKQWCASNLRHSDCPKMDAGAGRQSNPGLA